jgi:hypothetical protein
MGASKGLVRFIIPSFAFFLAAGAFIGSCDFLTAQPPRSFRLISLRCDGMKSPIGPKMRSPCSKTTPLIGPPIRDLARDICGARGGRYVENRGCEGDLSYLTGVTRPNITRFYTHASSNEKKHKITWECPADLQKSNVEVTIKVPKEERLTEMEGDAIPCKIEKFEWDPKQLAETEDSEQPWALVQVEQKEPCAVPIILLATLSISNKVPVRGACGMKWPCMSLHSNQSGHWWVASGTTWLYHPINRNNLDSLDMTLELSVAQADCRRFLIAAGTDPAGPLPAKDSSTWVAEIVFSRDLR